MSLQRQSRIACDIPECDATAPWVSVDGVTGGAVVWAAWHAAQALGWERGEYGGYCCPAHAPKAQRAERVAELVGQGLNDSEIGRRLGLSRGQVQYLRATRGIAGQRPGRPSSWKSA
jgi:hypothetical protein